MTHQKKWWLLCSEMGTFKIIPQIKSFLKKDLGNILKLIVYKWISLPNYAMLYNQSMPIIQYFLGNHYDNNTTLIIKYQEFLLSNKDFK